MADDYDVCGRASNKLLIRFATWRCGDELRKWRQGQLLPI